MSSFINWARRVEELPPYIFSEINQIKAEAQKRGISLLSLGIGDPDQPTPSDIIDRLREECAKPESHVYSPYEGTIDFRKSVSQWFQSRFGVALDAEREVVALIGSKEGVAHFAWAVCNPGDRAIYPSPGYPIFQTSCLLAGAVPIPLPLRAENGFLPDVVELEALFKAHQPKYMILNFPSNPTSVTCPRELLTEIVALAKKHEVIIGYDNAYSELYYDEKDRPISILEIPGAKDVAIEFHSLSKTFNMTGWRIGFAVGNEKLVAGLLKIKTNIDSGPLIAVQRAASFALRESDRLSEEVRAVYIARRKVLLEGLDKIGIEYLNPKATLFVWARVPNERGSMQFCKDLIREQGLVITPGIGFGEHGEHFFRFALTVPESSIKEALVRLEHFMKARPN